jgi:hypothetical protein
MNATEKIIRRWVQEQERQVRRKRDKAKGAKRCP